MVNITNDKNLKILKHSVYYYIELYICSYTDVLYIVVHLVLLGHCVTSVAKVLTANVSWLIN